MKQFFRPGLSIIIVQFILVLLISMPASAFSPQTTGRVGWWKFENSSDLLAPEPGYGLPLVLNGTHTAAAGSSVADHAVLIGPGSYYGMDHQILPNGGGAYVNEYTLQIDFMVSETSVWHCFFQTNPDNTNDGDCFINPTGKIGVAATGYTVPSISPDEWYRLVITVDNGSFYRYYIDGHIVLEGNVQDVDGRFALASELLMFADEDGEDNPITISEIGIWDRPLDAMEVAQLGGFGHELLPSPYFVGYPFLQTLTDHSVYISWHDTLTTITRVEYGTTQALGQWTDGSSELLETMYRWHTVKLEGLQPATKYYYRILTGSSTSPVYHFTTMPGEDYQGHVRFLLFSDTQDDSAKTGYIVRSARQKMEELYGPDLSDNINLVMHTGDIVGSGSVISYWTDQFFRPFSPFSASVPFLSVIGNHEIEHLNYYTYMKYEDISGFPEGHPLFEKVWTYRMPRILMIGLNTNMSYSYGSVMEDWLDSRLDEAENDATIDFVFCFMHHPPVTELWGEGNNSYVENVVLPVLKKYSKVQQLSYGHTHAYERGVIESESPVGTGDFRISCVGGGGGARDRWGSYINVNYPYIHVALDHHFYILFDFDLASRSYTGQMFDLGNADYPVDNEVKDQWHRRLNQSAPTQPLNPSAGTSNEGNTLLMAGTYSGPDELMSSQFQLSDEAGNYGALILNRIRNWQDIYGVDAYFNPLDLNEGIDLGTLQLEHGTLQKGKTYYFRARYRDQNLRWSPWSGEVSFIATDTTGLQENDPSRGSNLRVKPGRAGEKTDIHYRTTGTGTVSLEIYSSDGTKVKELRESVVRPGDNHATFDSSKMGSGLYYCRLSGNGMTESAGFMLIH